MQHDRPRASSPRSVALVLLALFALAPRSARAQGRTGDLTEEEQTFQAAENAFKEGRDDDALALYEKVDNLNPVRADAWLKRLVILYKHKQYAAAMEVSTRARQLLPNDASLLGQEGLTLYRLGRTDEAVERLERAVKELPDAYQLQLQLGQHDLKIGDGHRAVAAFEAYFRTRPEAAAFTDPAVRSLSGAAYLLERRYPEARHDLEVALASDPRDVSARISLGTVYAATGECESAVSTYQRVIGEAPRLPVIWLNLGTCLLRLNRRAQAEKSALAYTEARADDEKGFVLLGDARAELGNFAPALAAYETARKLLPAGDAEFGVVDGRVGRAYLSTGNFPKALEALEAAAQVRADDAEIALGLLRASIGARAPRERLLDLANRVQQRWQDGDASLVAGEAFYAAADYDLAYRAFERAAAAGPPSSVRPRRGMQLALLGQAAAATGKNDLPAAEALLLRAQQLFPESVVTGRNLGLVYLLDGKFDAAEATLAPLLTRVEHDVVINRLLGRAEIGLHRRAEAIFHLEAAAKAAEKLRGPSLAEIYVELGPLYLEAEKIDQAVSVLEAAEREGGAVQPLVERNLAIAHLRRGLERQKDARQADAALDDLGKALAAPRPSLAPKEATAVGCALSLAALKLGKTQFALDGLSRAGREGGCPFRAPYDRFGLELFAAYAAYRDAGRESGGPAKLEATSKTLAKLLARAPALEGAIHDLLRSSLELQGTLYYARGDEKKAAVALRAAAKAQGSSTNNNLAHNLAVLDLDEGAEADAARVLETLSTKIPEALVNLGVLDDRKGEPKKALELYRRALDHGIRSPRVKEWVDVKERMLASGAPR